MRERWRTVIINGLLLTLTVLVCLWGLLPAWGRWRELVNENRQLQTQMEMLRADLKTKGQMRRQYEALIEQLGEPLDKVAVSSFTPKFMKELEGIAKTSGIKVQTLQPLQPEPSTSEGWANFSAQITAQGSLKALVQMLLRMRTTVPPMEVERLSIGASSEKADTVAVQMQVNWYALRSGR